MLLVLACAGDKRDIERVATEFVIGVSKHQGFPIGTGFEGVSGCDIEGSVTRKEPSSGHKPFGGVVQTGAIGALEAPIGDDVSCGFDDGLGFCQLSRVHFGECPFARANCESV